MKVIISHDIDHITVGEHFIDLVIPKFIVRSGIELVQGFITIKEFSGRFKELISNKWQYIEEIIEFEKTKGIKSSFFIGVAKGAGLNYKLNNSQYWIKRIMDEGFEIGVHGIEFSNYEKIKSEYETFKNITGLESFGIRLHYLRSGQNTSKFLAKAGYAFDSSISEILSPYKIDNMWEFPLHIMDGDIMYQGKRYQNINLANTKEYTINKLKHIMSHNVQYLTVLFHDRYFNNNFLTWKNWYSWLIDYFIENKIEFSSYRQAINDLKSSRVKG